MIFDQYQRYKTMEHIVQIVKNNSGKNKLTILEIGANEECNLEKVLPDEDIQYSDLFLSEEMRKNPKFITVNGADMKEFKDGQYDIIIASDVFEHVPEQFRKDFLQETTRVAGYMAIICFPYKAKYVEGAEKRANSYYKMIFGKEHIWLKEHIDNGLPNINIIVDFLSKMDIGYGTFYQGDILLWEEMMKTLFATYDLPQCNEFFENINQLYAEQVYYNDVSDFNYRIFLTLSKDKELVRLCNEHLNQLFQRKQDTSGIQCLIRSIDDLKRQCELSRGSRRSVNNFVYFDKGQGFNELDKVVLVSESVYDNHILFNCRLEIDESICAVRFDPAKGNKCILEKLSICSNNGQIEKFITNGACIENLFYFNSEDSEILIDIKESIRWIEISASIHICGYGDSPAVVLPLMEAYEKKLQEQRDINLIESNKIQEIYQEERERSSQAAKECIALQTKLDEIKEQWNNTNILCEEWKEKYVNMEASLMEAQNKKIELEEDNNNLRQSINAYRTELDGLNNSLNLSQEVCVHLQEQYNDIEGESKTWQEKYMHITNTKSWKITKPLRKVSGWLEKSK